MLLCNCIETALEGLRIGLLPVVLGLAGAGVLLEVPHVHPDLLQANCSCSDWDSKNSPLLMTALPDARAPPEDSQIPERYTCTATTASSDVLTTASAPSLFRGSMVAASRRTSSARWGSALQDLEREDLTADTVEDERRD